jgi:hypothetical protein
MATIETRPDRIGPSRPVAATPELSDLSYGDLEPTPGYGWVLFSAIVLGLMGIWAFFEGMLAIFDSKVYVGDATFVFSDLHTWGWIVMTLGILAAVASFAVVAGSEVGRWYGIAVAGLYALGQLLFVDAYPWWSMAMFAVAILAIYGLAVYGGKRLLTG